MNPMLTIITKREDIRDCEIAILETEDIEILEEAKKHSKFVLIFGEKAECKARSEVYDFISKFELFKLIIERIQEPIIVHDMDRILYANPKAKEIFSDALNRSLVDLIPPNFRSVVFQSMEMVLKGERVEPIEVPLKIPDLKEVWVEMLPSLVAFEGKPAILLVLRDLTKKKRAEEKYKEFFENSLDIIVVTDLEGKYVEVNRAFEETFGYTREEIVGRNFAEILRLQKETAEEIFKSYNRAFREKRDLRGLVFEVKRKDGRKIVVEGNVRLLWEGGRIVGFVGNYRDITDRVKLEKKLKESEERYRVIFENSPIQIALVDENGVFIEANPTMVKSIGVEPIGKSYHDLFSKEVAERRIQNLRKAIEKNEVLVFEDEREGRSFVTHYVPIKLEGKKCCLIIAHEITEILRLNKFLRLIIEINEAMVRVRDKKKLIEKVERILSDYSARISDQSEESCFKLSHGGKEYGYLCLNVEREEEKKLIQSLAENLAFSLKAMEDEKRKEELYQKLLENIQLLAYLVDGIRNPLAAIRAYSETLIGDEAVREKILRQVDRIVEIMKSLDIAWMELEKFCKEKI